MTETERIEVIAQRRRAGSTWAGIAGDLNAAGDRRDDGEPWTPGSVHTWAGRRAKRGAGGRHRRALARAAQAAYDATGSLEQAARSVASRGWRTVRGKRPTRASIRRYITRPPPPAEPGERPRTRADCVDGPRPCPWMSCQYHLGGNPWAAQDERVGLALSRPEVEDGDMSGIGYTARDGTWVPVSCALDVADAGPIDLRQIGEIEGTSREWQRKLIHRSMALVSGLDERVAQLMAWIYEATKGRRY